MSKIFQINNTITLVPSITAPTIVEALDNVTGLIPVRVAAVGITVECRLGAARLGTDWVSIEIRTAGTIPGPWSLLLPPRQISTAMFPVPPPIFNIFVPGGAGGFENGVYELRNLQYRNGPAGPGAALDESFPAPFRVDTIAPYATLSIPFSRWYRFWSMRHREPSSIMIFSLRKVVWKLPFLIIPSFRCPARGRRVTSLSSTGAR